MKYCYLFYEEKFLFNFIAFHAQSIIVIKVE